MDLQRTVIDAASWRVASSLARRHPEFRVTHEHAGGGLYDELVLSNGHDCLVRLNRAGKIRIKARGRRADPTWESLTWEKVLSSDLRELNEEIATIAGLLPVHGPVASTKRTLVYRALSALACSSFLGEPVDIQMSWIDSAGQVGGAANWIDDYPDIAREVTSAADGDAAGRHRHAATQRFRIAFHTDTGECSTSVGRRLKLMQTYEHQGRSMPRLMSSVMVLATEVNG